MKKLLYALILLPVFSYGAVQKPIAPTIKMGLGVLVGVITYSKFNKTRNHLRLVGLDVCREANPNIPQIPDDVDDTKVEQAFEAAFKSLMPQQLRELGTRVERTTKIHCLKIAAYGIATLISTGYSLKQAYHLIKYFVSSKPKPAPEQAHPAK